MPSSTATANKGTSDIASSQTSKASAGRAEHLHRQAEPDDPAPVDAVGDIAGDQGQQEQRQELGEPDHAEPEARLAGCSSSARAMS